MRRSGSIGRGFIKYFVLWLALAGAVGAVWLLGGGENSGLVEPAEPEVRPEPTAEPEEMDVKVPQSSERGELAGVWVPYMSLNVPEHTREAFEANFKSIADSAREKGLNALFVHVRPFSDALYPSELYPWSHILTGTQGQDPGFDPLKFMVEYTHSLGMEFHAWINPLRVQTTETPSQLSGPIADLKADAPYYFMEWQGALYLDPAYPYVRTLIAKGASEIAEKYPVDGIHFDDYFYPSQDGSLDAEAYQLHVETVSEPLGLQDWRRANINAMVAEVYDRVKSVSPDVQFGISPQGNIENDMDMGADVEAWCAVPGYIDYVCPQVYYGFENPGLNYTQALEDWQGMYRRKGLELYIGLALYKAGDSSQGEAWTGGDVISRQIKAARELPCNGVILYSSDFLDAEQTGTEMKNAVETLAGID